MPRLTKTQETGLPHRADDSVSNNGGVRRTATNAIARLRRRVASLNGEDASCAFVYPTGMAAIAAAHLLADARLNSASEQR